MDVDDVLITLWEAGFTGIDGPSDLIARGDANRARRALGLATRREVATVEYWCKELVVQKADLDRLLAEAGVSSPYQGGHLCAKAIRRLRVESRQRKADLSHSPLENAELLRFEWHSVGHEMSVTVLSVDDVLAIHETLVVDFRTAPEPIDPPGVRSDSLLSSAVMRPTTALGDIRKYPTIEMASAALFHSIVHNHPFHNGNKRTALVAMLVMLDENSLMLTCNEDALFKVVLQVAQHSLVSGPRSELADRETLALAQWLKDHCRWVERGDRAIPWRRLEQILRARGCRIEPNRQTYRIIREISRKVKYLPLFSTSHRLVSLIHFGGSGREVLTSTTSRVRRELELDEAHGVDSSAFYDDAQTSTSDFIARYRKTLNRLARL